MRIHGTVKICRRSNVVEQTDYQKYRDELREDFGFICGYCGKEEAITSKGFEIDHFVPKSIAPERETDYFNLVYACFTCNRKKSKKWPTKDKDLHNDGKVGFVDPATDEFDLHLQRNENGDIQGITDVGKYMCKQVFKFNINNANFYQLYKHASIICLYNVIYCWCQLGNQLTEFYFNCHSKFGSH